MGGRASPTCPVPSQPGRLTRHLGSPVLFVASARVLAVTRRWGCGSRPRARGLGWLEKRGTRAAELPRLVGGLQARTGRHASGSVRPHRKGANEGARGIPVRTTAGTSSRKLVAGHGVGRQGRPLRLDKATGLLGLQLSLPAGSAITCAFPPDCYEERPGSRGMPDYCLIFPGTGNRLTAEIFALTQCGARMEKSFPRRAAPLQQGGW